MSARQAGFTLIEILMALAVFALLAAAGIALMRTGLDSRAAVAHSTDRVAQLQRARAILRSDFAQLRLRAGRNEGGLRRDWKFLGNARPTSGEPLLAFTRGGWTNPAMAEPRSELAYVELRLEEERLVRRLLLRPDPTRATPAGEEILFDGVKRLRVSYFLRGAWRDEWRVPAAESGTLPEAVAIELDLTGIGRVHQVFLTQEAPS